MPLCSQRVIVINGVRYHVAIRMDTDWSYTAEWWNNSEYHKHTFDDRVQSTSQAERAAIDEIHRARQSRDSCLRAGG
jgi:hypothetical protein